jgi:hypothetical protein
MVNREALLDHGLRAYERGRLRMAIKVALVVVPLTALCLLEPVGRATCAACGALLLAAAIWLRFRDRIGVDSVATGLLAGGIPLVAALALGRFGLSCANAAPASLCTAFAILIGGAVGSFVAVREAAARDRPGHWAFTTSIAGLVASLGCARLGLASVAAVACGIIVGRAAAPLLRKPG